MLRRIIALLMAGKCLAAIYQGGSLWQIALPGAAALCFWLWGSDESAAALGEGKNAGGFDGGRIDEGQSSDPGLLGKARTDYASIQSALEQLQDPELTAQLTRLQSVAGRIGRYLKKNPKKLPAARHFINYYQDKTASLLRQYISLRDTGVQPQELADLRREMMTTFRGFEAAYEKQFEKLVVEEFIDMGAEIKAARQMMESDGIDCDGLEPPPGTVDGQDRWKAESAIGEQAVGAGEEKSRRQSTPAGNTPPAGKKTGGWDLKKAGLAAGALFLGAVGLYKIFGEKDEE